MWALENCTDEFFEKWPKKVGFCPFLKTKSGQKNLEAFSENGTFWAFFARFWAICANLGTDDCKKAHLPTFISYLIAIKSFNIYINKASKVGFWPQAIFHTTNQSICQEIFYKKTFSFFGCYVIIKAPHNFIHYSWFLCDFMRLYGNNEGSTFSVCLLLWGRTFLMPLRKRGNDE